MNVFYLLSADGEAFGDHSAHLLENLRKRSRMAADGQTDGLAVPKPIRSRRAGAIPVRPRVHFPETGDGNACIIEVQGRDRPGLLYLLAAELSKEGFDITSAHIEVVGTTAVDAFYVRCAALDDARKKVVRKRLLQILRDPDKKSAKKAA